MPRTALTACTAALLTLLAGCGGTLPPSDLASLDGAWEGDINRVRGDQTYCKVWGVRLAIRKGAVSGEAFDVNARNVAAPFDGYVETDGRMFIDARVGGDVVSISGTFSRNSFSGGSSTPAGCRGVVSLSRARAAR